MEFFFLKKVRANRSSCEKGSLNFGRFSRSEVVSGSALHGIAGSEYLSAEYSFPGPKLAAENPFCILIDTLKKDPKLESDSDIVKM